MAHAYFFAGDIEEGITSALSYAHAHLQQVEGKNQDLVVLRHSLFSVDDAHKIASIAYRAPDGQSGKVLVISLTRIFHEAQNALLKLFEEPPVDTTLILVVPSAGMLLPTLRSRLLQLPGGEGNRQKDPKNNERPGDYVFRGFRVPEILGVSSTNTEEFLKGSADEREKIVAKLITRSKSDNDEEKQRVRYEILQLIEGLMASAHHVLPESDGARHKELLDFLRDLSAFQPILHERSAPLKLILEHLLIVIPKGLPTGTV